MKRPWTNAELQTLREQYSDLPAKQVAAKLGRTVSQIYQAADRHSLKKSAAFFASDAARRIQRGQQSERMKATQFKPGMQPWNKGKAFNAGGRSTETRFKAGRPPQEATNYLPIGSLRVTKDGYLEQKITDDHPTPARRWQAVHRLVWQEANGPVPRGHVVVFKPGKFTADLQSITLDRVECISRSELIKRNHWSNKSADLKALVPLKSAIIRAVNRANRRQEQHHADQ